MARSHGAKNGRIISPGIDATTLIKKNAGHPTVSAIEPDGEASTSLPTAIKLDNKAYCVAENRGLQSVMMKPTNAAVASPLPSSA